MYTIKVFHTHIEVFPYSMGDCEYIEKILSKYVKNTHKRENVAFHVQDDILYLPKGINLAMLQKLFNATPSIIRECDDCAKLKSYNMTKPPRSRIEEDAIQFLLSEGPFINGKGNSQFGLNLDTGDGKTYCMIAGIVKLKLKAIIITDRRKIRDMWLDEIAEMSTISRDKMLAVEGSDMIERIMSGKLSADIYAVNHQTIESYARLKGWNAVREFFKTIKVGIKVIDEAHNYFTNSLMIDFFSNVKYSFYLTATFMRGDAKEAAIYKGAYSSLSRFGESTNDYEEKRKHIIFFVVMYNSKISQADLASLYTTYGFSGYKYIEYALYRDENRTMMKAINKIIQKIDNIDGRILITSPKVESVEYITDKVSDFTDRTVTSIHNKTDKNNMNIDAGIISSTVKSFGTGLTVKGLRFLINTEPIGSVPLMSQLRGRLREYSPTEDTYMYHLVDVSVPECLAFYKRVRPMLRKKCKEICVLHFDDI